MIKVQPAITQMNNGHIAPILEGRTDVQIYGYSSRQNENAIPLVYGANKNRGGTLYVTSTKDSTKKAALIPFKVSESISYQLEFGDGYIRFYKNHEPILSNSVPYEVETFYQYDDLFDSKGIFQIDYQQSADVMYLVHRNYNTMKLERYGDASWLLGSFNFKNGPWYSTNSDKNKKVYVSGSSGNITITAIDTSTAPEIYHEGTPPIPGAYSFHFQVDNVDYPDANWHSGSGANGFYMNLAKALNSCQTDLLAVGSGNSSIRITATNNFSNYANKTLKVQYKAVHGSGYIEGTTSYTFNSGSGDNPHIFTSDMVGRKIRIKNILAYDAWYSGKENISIGTIVTSDNKYYKATASGTCGNVKPIHEEGVASDGKITWEYIGDGYGIATITEVISYYQVKAIVEKNFSPSLTASQYASNLFEFGIIGDSGIYPSSVCFFKDRLVFGTDSKDGSMLIFSKTGDYENFDDLTFGEVLSDNAITLPILTDLNHIQWVCAIDNLFVGTEGGVIMVKPMTDNEVFGPNNITYDEISNIGTCKIKPIRIGDDILYLGRLAKDVYAIAYNFQSDSYEPDEVSLSAYDLLDAGITSWALQYEPNRIVWMVRRDGKLVGFTYNKKQQVRAFHLHTTQGEFESVSCIPSPDGTQDEIWFITKRNYGSNATERCVEYMHNGIPLGIPFDKQANYKLLHEYILKNCVYLDSAKVYNLNPASDSLTGLGHLEGLTVGVVADGVYVGEKTVSSGTITLNSSATNVVVGLPYATIVEPMPINVDMPNGSGQARSQRINQVVARIYRTASFEYSWGKDWHKAPVKDDFSLDLMSGDLLLSWGDSNTEIKLNSEDIVNSTGSRMIFRQKEPLPVYFISIYPQLEVSNG